MSSSHPDRADSSTAQPSSDAGDAEFEAALRSLARAPRIDADVAAELADHEGELSGASLARVAEAAQYVDCPRIGSVLDDRYRVVSVLGRGGMGVVFAAENLRTGKQVALKWIRFTREDDARRTALLARFDREARVVAKVRHPNVVDVYDVGFWQGKPFLVMERLVGESLRERIKRGAIPWEEAKPLLLGVLRGVGAAHATGVVHRDLKPDNIFLCKSAQPDVLPKVLDFGVAAIREPDAKADSLTRTGAMLGTPSYMALEQLTGEPVDARSDIYALGVVAYEMLTQRLPFQARSAADLAVMQATGQPTRPSQHVPALRGEVEALLLRALAKEPARRFASAEALADAIENIGRTRTSALRRAAPFALGAALMGTWALLDRHAQHPPHAQPLRIGARAQVVPTVAPDSALSQSLATAPSKVLEDAGTVVAPILESAPPTPDARGARTVGRRALAASPERRNAEQAVPPERTEAASPLTRIRVDDF